MKLKLLSIAVAMLFFAMLIPASAHAGYSMAISGKSDFQGTPYQPEVFNGSEVYIRIYLSDTSPSSLDITMTVEGELGQHIAFPEFTGVPSFTLFPGQNRKILYKLSLPASAPGKYTGSILAVGNPPATETTEGAGAVGKPVVGITITADVPSDVQIFDFIIHSSGFPDGQWATWGDNWSTNVSIVNGGSANFTGWCNLTLTGSAILEKQTFNITNLSIGGSLKFGKVWQSGLPLNTQYGVEAAVYSSLGEKKDEEFLAFAIPSPAEIISVEHVPAQVFHSDTVAVYATLASSDSTATLHWRVNNGTETTGAMAYAVGEFSAMIPAQAIGSSVQYWITSSNGVFSDRSPGTGSYSYYVFSPEMPDLSVSADSMSYSPFDPTSYQMNETDVTNIYIVVRNLGRGSASNFVVRVYDRETPIWNSTISLLEGQGGSTVVRFNWKPLEGSHILRFEVDPDNLIMELDENNNHFTIQEVTIGPAPPAPPTPAEEADSIVGLLPYIIIPIILALLIILLLRRKKVISVTVTEVKPSRHTEGGVQRYIYSCSVGDNALGMTKATEVQASAGSVIKVKVADLRENEDGAITWWNAEVIGQGKEEDSIDRVRKMAKKKKKEK